MGGLGGKPDRDMIAVWAECERQGRPGGAFAAGRYSVARRLRCRDRGQACGSDRTTTTVLWCGYSRSSSHCPVCDQWTTTRLVRPDGTEVVLRAMEGRG